MTREVGLTGGETLTQTENAVITRHNPLRLQFKAEHPPPYAVLELSECSAFLSRGPNGVNYSGRGSRQ